MNKKLKKNTFLYTLLYVMLVGGGSCKKGDWYDVKTSKTLAIPSTIEDMQALMDNDDLGGYGVGIQELASDGHYLTDENANALSVNERNAYTWSHQGLYTNVDDWSSVNKTGAYPKIFYCNLVLDGLKKVVPNNSEDQKKWHSVRGQALFHRAKAFYELSQVFSPVFNPNTADSDLGIPLRLESDINIPSVRSSLRQTYEQIIADLLMSKDELPIVPMYKTRPSKPAVFALLARIYISMENYTLAGNYADSCLQLYDALLDYNDLDTTSLQPINVFNTEVIFHSAMTFYTGSLLIDPILYATYAEDDLRRSVFYIYDVLNDVITFKGSYYGSIIPFSGLATDEVYLIKAECYARANNVNGAMKILNNLLRKRWKTGTFIDFVAVDKDDALKKILEERKKELLMRGLRWSDLRRLNRDERFRLTLTRTVGGDKYVLDPNSYKYTFPIPDDIISYTGMQQNDGWK